MKKPVVVLEVFADAYMYTALWSSVGDDGEPLDDVHSVDDISPATRDKMRESCADFIQANMKDLQAYCEKLGDSQDFTAWGRAGHDFWLTRNGHGAGYWDRGLGELGDRLADAARVYGSVDLYVGDDGKVHQE